MNGKFGLDTHTEAVSLTSYILFICRKKEIHEVLSKEFKNCITELSVHVSNFSPNKSYETWFIIYRK